MDSRAHKISAPDADCSDQETETLNSADLPGWTCLWLAGLFLLAFLPRALMAWKIGTVCDDAHYYIHVADALGKGDFAHAFSYGLESGLNLNIYPVILLALHRSGLEWITAGQVWGVLISSLTILPMYGWVRRIFDKRIALTACVLYAIHPELIEVSFEPIRGPTFWFLMTLGLYLSYRAVTEVRLWLFIAAGIATALAIHTRSEGWLLFTPMALWSFCRMSRFPNLRWKLSTGTAICLSMTPLLLVLVNVTLLRSHTQWEWGRLSQFHTSLQWVRSGLDSDGVFSSRRSSTTSSHDQTTQSSSNGDERRTAVSMKPTTEIQGWTYLKGFLRSLEPVTVIFLFEGLLICFCSFQKRDKFVLACVAVVFLLAIWIRLSQIGSINARYFFPVYFLLVPFVAMGFLWSFHLLLQIGRRLFSSDVLQLVPAVGLSLILTCVYLIDALDADHRQREAERSFGVWLKEQYGPLRVTVANRRAFRVGYYASGTPPVLSDTVIKSEGYPGKQKPQLIVLSTRYSSIIYQQRLLQKLDRWKWIQLPEDELPETAAGFLVLVNMDSPARIGINPGIQSSDEKTQRQ